MASGRRRSLPEEDDEKDNDGGVVVLCLRRRIVSGAASLAMHLDERALVGAGAAKQKENMTNTKT
jgi:hypothetical protein